MERQRVVVVGGGFAGLNCVRALRGAPVEITVVDRNNHHLFQPLLYQVAMAGLSPADIASPIRSVLRRQANARVILGEAVDVDLGRRRLILRDGEVPYDRLVVAAGAVTSWFGHDEWAWVAPGLKEIEDALEIRRRVLVAFEEAEREPDVERRRELLTFVVIGGGPTGVELAGSLAELARVVVARDFRVIDPRQARIVLVEAAPRVLTTFPEELSEAARGDLARLGVEVRTATRVLAIEHDRVRLSDGELRSKTILWGAGVRASPLAARLGAVDRGGRVLVEPDLTLPGHPEVHVIGDMAAVAKGGPLPGIAPVAIQQGRYAGRAIREAALGRPVVGPFRYRDKGAMATIGRKAAVAVVGRLRLRGLVAWVAWLLIHIMYLVGFKNRLAVLMGWWYSYVTWRRGARLITGDRMKAGPPEESRGREVD